MNEQELREALRDAMTDASPPRPVTADSALTRAQRVRRARRANLAGLGIAVAVVALVAGAFTLNAPRTPLSAPSPPKTTATPSPTSPTAHGDRTQSNGPQNDKSVQLLTTLESVLPFPVKAATAAQTTGAAFGLRTHQAQVENWDTNTWSYQGVEPVVSGSGTGVGRVIVEVEAPGNNIPADLCQAAQAFWGVNGDCVVKHVGNNAVGLITHTLDERIGSVAAFRYKDGTVVYVAQSKDYFMSNLPPLPSLPLTDDQLVTLALTPGFKVG